MPSSTTKSTATVDPRPSASLVIVNARNEILLVQRNPQASSFAGYHVFPGGNYDEDQDDTLAMTAIRETFEESGILLASPSPPSSSILDEVALHEARQAVHARRMLFRAFLAEHQLEPDSSSLLPFTRWVTPVNAPRRFRTQFFVVFLSSPISGFSSGGREERVPTPDGGQEIISARFLHPRDAIAEFQDGKITLIAPQFYILSTLSDILHGCENTPAQREQVETLSRGLFGRMLVNPRMVSEQSGERGRFILTFEGDETRGGSKGRLHRVSLKSVKGRPIAMTLFRNFDIFTEIEQQAFELVKL